jgi:hypothetical protein
MGCDTLTAATIAAINWAQGVPQGVVYFMHMVIEYEVNDE